MRGRLSIAVLVLALPISNARAEKFGDLYGEGVYLGAAKTTTGLLNLRYGENALLPDFEVYGVGRIGGDTRTYLEKSDAIYNDNFLFLGLGIDYLISSGIRMTLQAGGSFDLNSKIDRSGFDLRTGLMTYHEFPGIGDDWTQEVYSEALYVHRYRNFLADVQWKAVYKMWDGENFGLEPLGALAMSVDSKGFDYNRFVEFRLGARLRSRYGNLALIPMYVAGSRWAIDDVNKASYREFRVLLTTFFAF